jgi:hypothetical protein
MTIKNLCELLTVTVFVTAPMNARVYAQERMQGAVPIVAIPQIQAGLARAVDEFAKVDRYRGSEDALRALWEVKDTAGNDLEVFVQQCAFFMANAERARDDKGATIPLMFFNALEISDGQIIRALAPFLDATDTTLRDIVHKLFVKIDGRAPGYQPPLKPTDYSKYEGYIHGLVVQNESIPEPFAAHIYRKSPGDALAVFVYAHSRPPLPKGHPVLWAEHIVSGAIWRKQQGFDQEFEKAKAGAVAELEKLSKDDLWWVRLYVAEIVRQHPDLANERILERLRNDPNVLVQNTLKKQSP